MLEGQAARLVAGAVNVRVPQWRPIDECPVGKVVVIGRWKGITGAKPELIWETATGVRLSAKSIAIKLAFKTYCSKGFTHYLDGVEHAAPDVPKDILAKVSAAQMQRQQKDAIVQHKAEAGLAAVRSQLASAPALCHDDDVPRRAEDVDGSNPADTIRGSDRLLVSQLHR